MAGCFDTEGVAAEVYGIEIHGQDVFLAVQHLDFDGSDPFLGFHNQQFYTGDIAQQTCGILRADFKQVFTSCWVMVLAPRASPWAI